MPPLKNADPADLDRVMAQRNAAFAAAFLLTGVVICAGWALEVFPRRNAEVYRLENASLSSGLVAAQQALAGTQRDLAQTQEALKQTEEALRNTQEAIRLEQKGTH